MYLQQQYFKLNFKLIVIGLIFVEAAVMLDVVQGLADQLKNMDTTLQRELMLRKYRLLTAAVDINNKEASYAAARKALEEGKKVWHVWTRRPSMNDSADLHVVLTSELL